MKMTKMMFMMERRMMMRIATLWIMMLPRVVQLVRALLLSHQVEGGIPRVRGVADHGNEKGLNSFFFC
jgi:hypothetical protein